MSHAVLTINPANRASIAEPNFVLLRLEFAALALQFRGRQILLYQSGRGAAGVKTPSGYFATAVLDRLYHLPDNATHCAVGLKDIVPFDVPRPMLVNGLAWESGLLSSLGAFDGRKAARDFRIITPFEFGKIASSDRSVLMDQIGLAESTEPPLFADRHIKLRDPIFASGVYFAYLGKCAISGVTLMSADGRICGLEAAHIYPYRLEALNSVRSSILLAPSWHRRYDMGAIVVHDDYSWSAVIEDADTMAIVDRHLELPNLVAEWPDIDLIRPPAIAASLASEVLLRTNTDDQVGCRTHRPSRPG